METKQSGSDADVEMTDEWEDALEGTMEDGGTEKGKGKEMNREEDQNTDNTYTGDTLDEQNTDDALDEPNFIWNEGKHNRPGSRRREESSPPLLPRWGQVHPETPPERRPKPSIHPQGTGGEPYGMRELLVYAAHYYLVHYGVSKTYRDLSCDTFWPGQGRIRKALSSDAVRASGLNNALLARPR